VRAKIVLWCALAALPWSAAEADEVPSFSESEIQAIHTIFGDHASKLAITVPSGNTIRLCFTNSVTVKTSAHRIGQPRVRTDAIHTPNASKNGALKWSGFWAVQRGATRNSIANFASAD